MNAASVIKKMQSGLTPEIPELVYLLDLPEGDELKQLYSAAYQTKLKYVGNKIHLRGIIEFSNICTKNCYYCGIRRGNHNVTRYQIPEEDILSQALEADQLGLGSVVLQSGERSDEEFVSLIERLVRKIKEKSGGRLGITLSTGEQSRETYLRWFKAGAHRFLLRIEASDPELYAKIHPADHSWEKRKNCLTLLSDIGYQTGTGVMLGLPFQTTEHIAKDILFYQDMNMDMIGMGPYIVHEDTPLAKEMPDFDPQRQLLMGLKAIAVTRLLLKDVNIASTTALQALHPDGRKMGLLAGANVIMPNITESRRRAGYLLYKGKPGVNDDSLSGLELLKREAESAGEEILWNDWGDSPHYFARSKQ